VHIDHVTLTGAAAGLRCEVRVFLEGERAGCGGLEAETAGDDGWHSIPVVALVGERLAITVEADGDEHGPRVHSWDVVVDAGSMADAEGRCR
jgi:hypothetical protein